MTDTGQDFDEAERFSAVADELCEAVEALRRVDYNAMLVDDLERLLDLKRELSTMTLRYRSDQHAAERSREGVVDLADQHGEADG